MGYDKSLEYIANTQTLVGEQKRHLIDRDTGEEIIVDQISKRVYGSKQFWKCYLMDFLTVLGIIDSKQLDIFIYIVENTDQARNLFIGTQRDIAKNTNSSIQTVSTIIKKLIDNNFIVKKQNGVYMVNPNLLMKGNDHKRQILLSYYESETPLNGVAVSGRRTKRKAIPEQTDPDQMTLEAITAPEPNESNDNRED